MASSSRTAPPTQPAGTYAVNQLHALQQEAQRATTTHLVAAADYIVRIFNANDIPLAFMGGFSVKVRGSDRETFDVDVAVGCDMATLIQVLTPQSRVVRPLGPVSGVMRIFVKTGGQFEENLLELWVEVDLILRGSLGAPDDPRTMSEDVSIQTTAGPRQYRLLDLQNLLISKLGAAFARSGKNDFDDILYLVTQYPEKVWEMRQHLSNAHRQHFINRLYQTRTSKLTINKAQQALGVAGFAEL